MIYESPWLPRARPVNYPCEHLITQNPLGLFDGNLKRPGRVYFWIKKAPGLRHWIGVKGTGGSACVLVAIRCRMGSTLVIRNVLYAGGWRRFRRGLGNRHVGCFTIVLSILQTDCVSLLQRND
jgi:hypothetical protein